MFRLILKILWNKAEHKNNQCTFLFFITSKINIKITFTFLFITQINNSILTIFVDKLIVNHSKSSKLIQF